MEAGGIVLHVGTHAMRPQSTFTFEHNGTKLTLLNLFEIQLDEDYCLHSLVWFHWCGSLAGSYPPLWGMFRFRESNEKLVSILPSVRNFAEGNWAGGEAFACVPTFRMRIS